LRARATFGRRAIDGAILDIFAGFAKTISAARLGRAFGPLGLERDDGAGRDDETRFTLGFRMDLDIARSRRRDDRREIGVLVRAVALSIVEKNVGRRAGEVAGEARLGDGEVEAVAAVHGEA